MGCGPSRVGITRLKLQRKKNNNNNAHEKHSNSRRSSENDHKAHSSFSKRSPNDFYVQRSSHLSEDIGIAKKRIANKIRPISGPLQPPMLRSPSQVDFFRMLDEKIASGRDYNPEEEKEVEVEPVKTSKHSAPKAHRWRSSSWTSPGGWSRKEAISTLDRFDDS